MILLYGEVLVDLIKSGNNSFACHVGGAPFNVAYAAGKISKDVLFVGNVGNDYFGDLIIKEAQDKGIDSSHIFKDSTRDTTIAIVENDVNGERRFFFVRKNGADFHLPPSSLNKIAGADIIHLGALMLSEKEGVAFARELISEAKKQGKKISFDINYREDIFKSREEAIDVYESVFTKCDILKFSADELSLFAGEGNVGRALKKIAQKDQQIFVTMGRDGSLLYTRGAIIEEKSINIEVVDTTGAGDAFYGTVLAFIDKYGYEQFFTDEKTIRKSLRIANIQGAFATTKKGALSGVVDAEQLYGYYERE